MTATIDDKGKVTLSPDPIVVTNNGAVRAILSATSKAQIR